VNDDPISAEEPLRASRTRWGRAVGICLIALLALAAGAATWLINDADRVRKIVESQLTELSDRQFSIEGEFDFSLGETITVQATDIRWHNPVWSSAPYMLEIGQFRASVNTLSLLWQPVKITAVEVGDATLLFEWTEAEEFNWEFGDSDDDEDDTLPKPLPLLLTQADLKNIVVHFRHPDLTEELTVKVPTAAHQEDADHRLVVSGDVLLGEQEELLVVNGQIGPFPELAVGGAVDFDIQASGQIAQLSARGNFDWLARLQNPDFAVTLTAPEAETLLDRLSLPVIANGPVDLQSQINVDDDEVVAVAVGQLGDFKIDATLAADSITSFEGFSLAVDASGPSAGNLLSLIGVDGLMDAPYELEIRAQRTDRGLALQKFALNTTLAQVNATGLVRTLPAFRNFDLKLSASGTDIRNVTDLFALNVGRALPFDLDAAISSNGVGVDDKVAVSFKLGKLATKVTGTISEDEGFAGSQFDYSINAPDIGPLTSLFGVALTEQVPVELQGAAKVEEKRIVVDNLTATVSATNLSGTGIVNLEPTGDQFDVNVRWRGANFAAALQRIEFLAAIPMPAVDFDATAQLRLADHSLRVKNGQTKLGHNNVGFDGKISFDRSTPEVNANITAEGDDFAELFSGLEIAGLPDEAFSAGGAITTTAEAISIKNLAVTLPDGTIEGSFVASGEDFADLAFDLKARGTNLANVFPDVEFWEPEAIPFDIKTRGVFSDSIVDIDAGSMVLGDANLSLSGELELEPQLRLREGDLNAAGPRLSVLGKVGGRKFTDTPFELSGAMEGTRNQGGLRNLKLTVGKSNLNGRIRLSTENKRPNIDLALTSDFFDLDEIFVADSAQDDSTTTSTDNRMLSDQPLPFDVLDGFDGKLQIEFDDFINKNRSYRSVSADVTLGSDVIDVQQFTLTSSAGSMTTTGTLRRGDNGPELQVAVTASNATLETADMTPEEIELLPQHAIEARLAATGNSPRSLAASANGYIWIVGGQGQVRRLRLGALWGDFATKLVNAVNPFTAQSAYTKTKCQGFYFDITDGKLTTSPAMVGTTDEVVILARGTIDLATEQIDLTFQTTPRKGVGISVSDIVSPFTSVGGTLSQPKLMLNKKGAAFEGGAALATGGLSIVARSLWQRWVSSRNVCIRIAEQAQKIRQQRDPENVPSLSDMAKRIN
jgi:uncharacterized protein involved in outer membrane biogenesis